MELSSIKFGLAISVFFMVGVGLLFALYWKLGEASVRKAKTKRMATAGSEKGC